MAHPYDDEGGRWRGDEHRELGDRSRGFDEPRGAKQEWWRGRSERDEGRGWRDDDRRWREVGGGREDERSHWVVRPRSAEDDRSRGWEDRGSGREWRPEGGERGWSGREGGEREGWLGGGREGGERGGWLGGREGGERSWFGGTEGGSGHGRGLFGGYLGDQDRWRGGEERWRGGEDRWRGTQADERMQRQGRAPKGYKRSDDRILDDIVERVMTLGIDAGSVEVKVENGDVTLTGEVRDRREKRRIEEACDDIRGVNDVHNQIRVTRGEDTTTDTGMH